jgi:UPF0755 protein
MRRRVWIRFLVIVFISPVFLVAGIYFFLQDLYTRDGPLRQTKIILIEKGAGVKKIAALLLDAGVINSPIFFRIGVRYRGFSGKLRAGEYKFLAKVSMSSVASLMTSGQTVKRRITVPEGLLAIQIKNIIMSAPGLTGKLSENLWRDGGFLPETYFYSYGDTRLSVVKRMQHKLATELHRAWRKCAKDCQLKTPAEALILASIIEKETGKSSEREHVSGVFHNRLRLEMPLQSDPTVSYGVTLGNFVLRRPLSRTDLQTASPFNTYLNKGLPPRPISNPGLAAIRAAMMPKKTKDIYFVANGRGGHVFSKTLLEHNRNVAKWRSLQRKANETNIRN